MTRALPLSLCALLLLSACEDDAKADVAGPSRLALGAYTKYALQDACAGGGKVSFCATELLRELDKVRIDDERVLRRLDEEEFPEGFAAQRGEIVVQADTVGKTHVRMAGRFSDRSRRSSSREVVVREIERIELKVTGCLSEATAPTFVLPGSHAALHIRMLADDKELSGYFEEPLQGEGIECALDGCRWQAPEEPGEVVIRSRLDAHFRATLSSFGPDDVSAVRLDSNRANRIVYREGEVGWARYQIFIPQGIPCESMDIQIETLSPEVCLGPEGEESWQSPYPRSFSFSAQGSGKCELAMAALGSSRRPARVAIDFDTVDDFTADRAGSHGDPCPRDGRTTCDRRYVQPLTCKGGVWKAGRECDGGEGVCELTRGGRCKDPEGCARCR